MPRGVYPRKLPAELADKVWMAQHYLRDERTVKSIAGELGVSDWTVKRALRAHGFEVRSNQAAIALRSRQKRERIRAAAPELYAGGNSIEDIAHDLGAHPSTVSDELKAAGVAIRTPREFGVFVRKRGRAPALSKRVRNLRREGRAQCVLCEETEALELHHLDADPSNNADENLVLLCEDHHMIVEWFIRPAIRRWVREANGVAA